MRLTALWRIIKERSKKILEAWNDAMNKWGDDNDIWNILLTPDWFNKVHVEGLSDYHSGDCTAFASSCSRCHAESVFKIPCTANWSKQEGYKMEQEFMADLKAKK